MDEIEGGIEELGGEGEVLRLILQTSAFSRNILCPRACVCMTALVFPWGTSFVIFTSTSQKLTLSDHYHIS